VTLSLCMIVKDEAELLPGCLGSVQDWVDELVIVDTGSQDDTVAIASAHGARVLHHRWRQDFAAARNVALEAATGSWVLLLDADERLAPGAGPTLRIAMTRDDLDCGLLPLHDAARLDVTAEEVLGGTARIGQPAMLPRLFRRVGDLRWHGVVHEHVDPWLAQRTHRMARVDAPIIHLGCVPQIRERRGKRARNIGLLRTRCQAEPDNPHVYAYLAAELGAAGALDQARQVADAGWQALHRCRPSKHNGWVALATVRLQVYRTLAEVRTALAPIPDAHTWFALRAPCSRIAGPLW